MSQLREEKMKHLTMQRQTKWSLGIGTIAVTASLVASLGVSTNTANAAAEWNGNGAPTILKTAPVGTPINAPAKNSLFACVPAPVPGTNITVTIGQNIGTKLSQAQTPWMENGNVVLSKVEIVPGKVKLKSVFKVTETKTTRKLKGNGIPNHPIGKFAIPQDSPSYKYYAALPAEGYANAAEIPVKPYHLEITLPKNPKVAAQPSCISSLMIGVSLTGASWHAEIAPDSQANIYDPNSALPTDRCSGHPYLEQYHYHGYSWKCMEQGKPGEPSPLLGYAIDGFGIYGPRGANGKLVTNAQLDECHGMVGEVMFNGKKQKMYHYVLNNEYPYSIGCLRGTPRPMVGMNH